MKKLKTQEVREQWMVLFRHYAMQGGVLDYGYAFIEGFFDTFEEADKHAKKVVKLSKNTPDPMVWVLRCTKTYTKGGVAISPTQNKDPVKK